MNAHLIAAAISGIVLGAGGLAHAQSNDSTFGGGDIQQLDTPDASKHACKGKNACKGQGGCKTEKNGCKAQNACKGQGGCRTDGGKPDDNGKDKNSCSGKSGCGSK